MNLLNLHFVLGRGAEGFSSSIIFYGQNQQCDGLLIFFKK